MRIVTALIRYLQGVMREDAYAQYCRHQVVVDREECAVAYNVRALWKTPGEQPNGLQDSAQGLWVLDQVDPNQVYLLRHSDGSILYQFPTRSKHGSGITVDPDGHVWVASTFGFEIICYDPETGRELRSIPAPGLAPGPGSPHALATLSQTLISLEQRCQTFAHRVTRWITKSSKMGSCASPHRFAITLEMSLRRSASPDHLAGLPTCRASQL